MSEYRDIAINLHQEATDLLNDESIWHQFRQSGELHAAGSYALDLLVWRDLDLYYEPNDIEEGLQAFAKACEHLIMHKQVRRIKLEKSFSKINPFLPEGTYLGIKIETSDTITWKVDIWMVDKSYQTEKLNEIHSLKTRIEASPDKAETILKLKHHLKGSSARTPSLSSYYVYKGVLEENVESPQEIEKLLKNTGLPAFQ